MSGLDADCRLPVASDMPFFGRSVHTSAVVLVSLCVHARWCLFARGREKRCEGGIHMDGLRPFHFHLWTCFSPCSTHKLANPGGTLRRLNHAPAPQGRWHDTWRAKSTPRGAGALSRWSARSCWRRQHRRRRVPPSNTTSTSTHGMKRFVRHAPCWQCACRRWSRRSCCRAWRSRVAVCVRVGDGRTGRGGRRGARSACRGGCGGVCVGGWACVCVCLGACVRACVRVRTGASACGGLGLTSSVVRASGRAVGEWVVRSCAAISAAAGSAAAQRAQRVPLVLSLWPSVCTKRGPMAGQGVPPPPPL